jgi:hypothetical protein
MRVLASLFPSPLSGEPVKSRVAHPKKNRMADAGKKRIVSRTGGSGANRPADVVEKGVEDWLGPWQFAALLALLLGACFPQVVCGLETFAYGDAGQFACPVAFYHRESFWRGELPFWNPLSSCGVPFLAQWNTLTLYPLSLIYLLLPFPWSFAMFDLAHLFLAGMGMYFLAHRWTGNRLAASVAGAVFAFNGLTWYGVMWPHIISALAWMPLVVLTAERAWREGGRPVVPAAAAAAMQWLTGGAEVIFQTWLLLAVLWLVEFFRGEVPRGRFAGRALLSGGLGVGLAAAQLLPFVDLLRNSQRTTSYGAGGMAGIAAMPLTGWANFLVPLFGCVRNPQGIWVQATQSWTASYYLGVGAVMLAVLAIWRCDRKVRVLAAMTAFSLLMALGSPGLVYDGLKRMLPLLGFIRFPVKFVMLAVFTVPLLAAFGLAHLREHPAEERSEWKRVFRVALFLLASTIIIVGFAWKFPVRREDFPAVAGGAVLRIVFLALILGCLILLRRQSDVKWQRLFQTALVLLFWFDVFTHSSDLSPTVPCRVMQPDAIRAFFHWDNELQAGQSRALQSRESLMSILSTGSADPELDANRRRLSQLLNFNLLDHVAKFDGFYSMDVKESLDVFKHVYFTTNEAGPLKDFLGIAQVSNPTNLVDWVARPTALPLVTAGQSPIFAGPAETMEAVLNDRFDPRRSVYLPEEARSEIRATGPVKVSIKSFRFSARELSMEVEAEAPAMVVVAQTFYHRWRVFLDGRNPRLWRANYAYQAFEVPAGTSRIQLVYEDPVFLLGLVLSLTSLFACGVICFRRRAVP